MLDLLHHSTNHSSAPRLPHLGSLKAKSITSLGDGTSVTEEESLKKKWDFATITHEQYTNLKHNLNTHYDLVLGATGAQITNQIFLKRGSKLVVICCSQCLFDVTIGASASLQEAGSPHLGTAPYLGFDTLYYLVDIPMSIPNEDSHGKQFKSLFIPDIPHFWDAVY